MRELLRYWKPGKDDDKSRGKQFRCLGILVWFIREGRRIRKKEEAGRQALKVQEEQDSKQKKSGAEQSPYYEEQGVCGKNIISIQI